MSGELVFTVGAEEHGRADALVGARYPAASRRRVADLFAEGAVRVNRRRARKGDMLGPGDAVVVAHGPTTLEELAAVADRAVNITLVHEDEQFLVLRKPAGVPSQPLAPGEGGCVANWLVASFPECMAASADKREAGLANRLDIGTSGLLLAARNAKTWRALRTQFHEGRVHKDYIALVSGSAGAGSCDGPLAQRNKRSIVDYGDGLDATTEWTVRESFASFTLLDCTARSGRMHQVRAHLAHAGMAIVGDAVYGGADSADLAFTGHFLHARSISFEHPSTGERLEFESPLPADRESALEKLRTEAEQNNQA